MNKEKDHDLVDETISAVEGGWEFTGEVAEHFDDHVYKSIPMYEEFQDMTVNMSEWFVHDGSTVYDIGCSTGETIARLVKKHSSKKKVQFNGIDNSEAMIKQARIKSSTNNVRFLHQNVTQVVFEEADMAISLFTLQFLEMKERIRILQDIYSCLSVGGALVIAEKVLAEEGRFDELWTELYWDFKRGKGLTDDQILHKARSIRGVLRPLTVQENIKMLRAAGFTSIDVFIKWYNFAGLLAIKTADTIDDEESQSCPTGQDLGKT